MKIKICGIRTLEDALAALEAGADMLGFNFYPQSPRYISPQDCAAILASLRASHLPVHAFRPSSAFTAVGVFVNVSAEEIRAVLEQCPLDLVQLSGDEPPETLRALGGRAFKALRPANREALQDAQRRYPPRDPPPAYLLDASRPGQYGGTGQIADWVLAAELARELSILLAGGLTPDNVAEAVQQVQPWGVDVASGVESAPGRKDPRKMASFVRNARQHSSFH